MNFEVVVMYFSTCIILLLATSLNAKDPLEERMVRMEEKMAEMSISLQAILTKMEKETLNTDISTPMVGQTAKRH